MGELTKSQIRELNLTLGVDLDGVVFDFDRTWCQRLYRDFGRVVLPQTPQRWDELHLLAGFRDQAEFWAWWAESGGFAGVHLYPGAREALRAVQARGWAICYVTNRPVPDPASLDELLKHRMPEPFNLAHVPDKWNLGLSLFVEDAPANLMMMGPHRGVRVRRPWNRIEDYPQLVGFRSIPDLKSAPLLAILEDHEREVALSLPT